MCLIDILHTGNYDDDRLKHDVIKMRRKAEIIRLSIKYSLVTKFTSFVAVEERKEGEQVCVCVYVRAYLCVCVSMRFVCMNILATKFTSFVTGEGDNVCARACARVLRLPARARDSAASADCARVR